MSTNNGNTDTPSRVDPSARATRMAHSATNLDDLTRLKQELLQAEVRLAKARATAAGAEIDIKVLNARLKAFTK